MRWGGFLASSFFVFGGFRIDGSRLADFGLMVLRVGEGMKVLVLIGPGWEGSENW